LEIRELSTSSWKKEKPPEEWKESIIAPIHKKGDKIDLIIIGHIHSTSHKFFSKNLLPGVIKYAKEIIGIINVAFDATGRLLIIYSEFDKYLRRNGNTMRKFISSI
jgi:hypothetical protein